MSVIETRRFRRAACRRASDQHLSGWREAYPAITSSVPAARQAIAELAAAAGASDEQLDAIRLASSEALSNVVQHAYRGRSGDIDVTARIAGDELWVLISDDGCGLHGGRDSDGLGLGLGLIAQMTDGFTVIERASGGTELRMRFVLRAGGSHRGQERGSDRDQERGSVSSATRPASPRFSTTR